MAQRHFNMSRGTLFIAFLIVGILMQLIPQKHTKRMNRAFLMFFNPVLNIPGTKIPRLISRSASPSSEDFIGKDEHDELWNAYKNSQAALLELQKRYETIAKIRTGLPEPGAAMVLAQVSTQSINGYGHELIINRGSTDGLKPGQYVIGPNVTSPDKCSLVGSLSEVSSKTATVRLLTDLKSTISITVRRGDKDSTISRQMDGNGINACKVPLVSREFDIKNGDTVYASAVQGLLETPIVIGQVSYIAVDQKSPTLWDITVTPVYKVNDLKDVAVIVMIPKDQPKKDD